MRKEIKYLTALNNSYKIQKWTRTEKEIWDKRDNSLHENDLINNFSPMDMGIASNVVLGLIRVQNYLSAIIQN